MVAEEEDAIPRIKYTPTNHGRTLRSKSQWKIKLDKIEKPKVLKPVIDKPKCSNRGWPKGKPRGKRKTHYSRNIFNF